MGAVEQNGWLPQNKTNIYPFIVAPDSVSQSTGWGSPIRSPPRQEREEEALVRTAATEQKRRLPQNKISTHLQWDLREKITGFNSYCGGSNDRKRLAINTYRMSIFSLGLAA